jgi:2-aminoethylphosphonate ABC transporter binding protein
MMILDSEGMLEPYSPLGVERILPQFKSGKSEPTWVGIDAWETAIIVNTVEFAKTGAKPIKSYEDLLQPELKDQIVMPNPASSGTGLLTVAGLLQLKGKDSEAGWDFLDKLHENVAQYVHSGSKPAKMAGAGEATIGISFGYAGIKQIRDGAPVDVIFPSDGSGWDLEANALMKKTEIKAAAKTFLDWAISDEAMDLYKANYPIITTGQGGKYDGFEGNPVDQLIDNDFVWVSGNRDSILSKWTERYDGKSAEEQVPPTTRGIKRETPYRAGLRAFSSPVRLGRFLEKRTIMNNIQDEQHYIVAEGITKKFGKHTVLSKVSLLVKRGELICILGPSGCGKTTLLRILAGLERTDSGSINIGGRDCTHLPPSQRNFGIVFQSYALFPNMTVEQNILFGLKSNKSLTKSDRLDKTSEVLDMVDLAEHRKKYPGQLSGGQQQRTALARALSLRPAYLLLDEPLSALDAKVRVRLRGEICRIQRDLGITTIMVTHDQEEALTMADRVVVMNNAGIEQIGTPDEVYLYPETPFVLDFIEHQNYHSRFVAV